MTNPLTYILVQFIIWMALVIALAILAFILTCVVLVIVGTILQAIDRRNIKNASQGNHQDHREVHLR
jgi:uncharacterized membrane protein YraQ (UPF0718 family)